MMTLKSKNFAIKSAFQDGIVPTRYEYSFTIYHNRKNLKTA